MRVRLIVVLVSLLAVLALALDAASRSSGITGVSTSGCTCHAGSPSSLVTPSLTGLPEEWTPGESYDLTVSFSGGPGHVPNPGRSATGGFNLAASAGTLSNAPSGGAVQLSGGQATHTSTGNDQSSWVVRWIAPSAPFGDGNVQFTLAVNSVNGDGTNSGDAWNSLAVTLPGPGDTTPPVISNVKATVATTGATISWTTDDAGTTVVDFGKTESYGTTVTGPSGVTSHSVNLLGLTPATLYHYRVRTTNSAGLESVSEGFTFTTLADTSAPSITLTRPATAIYANNVEVTTLSLVGPIVMGTVLVVEGQASDNVGVTKVEFYVDGVLKGDMTLGAGTVQSGTWRFTWDPSTANLGSHNLLLRALDGAGNARFSTMRTVTVVDP
ncbi:MAG TPA: choice-of-anchor V domain-containing protein [Candidatus Thermoplasmatota archaeon]|nr:choice-of-anchor V domain-containing protein [Candidatus Thermoplasmatota archaeon]